MNCDLRIHIYDAPFMSSQDLAQRVKDCLRRELGLKNEAVVDVLQCFHFFGLPPQPSEGLPGQFFGP